MSQHGSGFDPQMGTTNNAALIGMQDTLQGAVYMAQFCKVRKKKLQVDIGTMFPPIKKSTFLSISP